MRVTLTELAAATEINRVTLSKMVTQKAVTEGQPAPQPVTTEG